MLDLQSLGAEGKDPGEVGRAVAVGAKGCVHQPLVQHQTCTHALHQETPYRNGESHINTCINYRIYRIRDTQTLHSWHHTLWPHHAVPQAVKAMQYRSASAFTMPTDASQCYSLFKDSNLGHRATRRVGRGEAPGRWCCLMATKVEALLGNWLLGKRRLPATGTVGLPGRCLPVFKSSLFILGACNRFSNKLRLPYWPGITGEAQQGIRSSHCKGLLIRHSKESNIRFYCLCCLQSKEWNDAATVVQTTCRFSTPATVCMQGQASHSGVEWSGKGAESFVNQQFFTCRRLSPGWCPHRTGS